MFTVRPLWRTAAIWLGLLPLCFHSNLLAEHGRNFAGSYAIQSAHSDGQTVSFELSLRLVNYSGADLKDGAVTLEVRSAQPVDHSTDTSGAFEHVSLQYRKFIDLRGSFAVPEFEYQQWQRGATPNLIVSYLNEAGDSIQNAVELSKAR